MGILMSSELFTYTENIIYYIQCTKLQTEVVLQMQEMQICDGSHVMCMHSRS